MIQKNKITRLMTQDSRLLLSSVFCLLSSIFSLSAQQLNYTLNRDYLYGYDNYFNNKEEKFQTFVKPYRYVNINQVKDSSIAFPNLNVLTKTKSLETQKKKFNSIFILL